MSSIATDPMRTLEALAQLGEPFAAETAELFASVREHDITTLAARCDMGS